MNEADEPIFQHAISTAAGTEGRLLARERVHERFEGETVWEGEVLVFELEGHPSATRAYAWEADGEVVVVLGEGPVQSTRDAVRASIMAG